MSDSSPATARTEPPLHEEQGRTTSAAETTSVQPAIAARRGLVLFLVTVVALSAPLEAGIILTHAFDSTGSTLLWLTGLMSVPTIASLVARRLLGEGFADLASGADATSAAPSRWPWPCR